MIAGALQSHWALAWPWDVSNHTWPCESLEGFPVVFISGQAHIHSREGKLLPGNQDSEKLEAVIVPCVTLQTSQC